MRSPCLGVWVSTCANPESALMAGIVVLYILSWECQKSILETKNKKTPTDLLLLPPTQTPNYFTSFYKWPCSQVQIQKTTRDLQMRLVHFCLP